MFFMIAFRTSVGDYSFEDFPTAEYYEIGLVVWIFIMIVGNIVFMNFIIAVVNQSYEQCMLKMIVLQFKVKVDMIVERESMMKSNELERIEWFPNFIVLRRKANHSDSSNAW